MKNIILKYLYYLSLIFLIFVYLVPGNLFGYFLYGDLSIQPNLFSDPNGRSYDHFIYFTFLSIIGFLTYFELQSGPASAVSITSKPQGISKKVESIPKLFVISISSSKQQLVVAFPDVWEKSISQGWFEKLVINNM